jgi:hypothetical protein
VIAVCVAPASVTVPASSLTGDYTVSWGTSPNGVAYVLQEATDATFTTGLRQVYSGTATSAGITGRLSGKTYYYRVRATRPGYTPSTWVVGGNSCSVTLTVAAPASVTVPATGSAAGGYAVSWSASTTAGVSYVLQEATNATFTAGLRQAYSGANTSVSITGRSAGVTYYYQVRATRSGYTPSAWVAAGNGCVATLAAGAPTNIAVSSADADGSYPSTRVATAVPSITYALNEATAATFK